MVRKDGSTCLVSFNLKIGKDEVGNFKQAHSVLSDITERKRAERLEHAIYEIARAPETAKTLNDLYRSVHQIIKGLMPAENFYVALYDEKEDLLSYPYFVDEIDVPDPPQKLGKDLTAYVLRTGSALLCDAALDEEMVCRGEVEMVGVPSSCWLGVPLKAGGKTIGAMVVQHYSDPKAYGEREAQVLDYVSGQVANAIERKRAEEALRESEAALRALHAEPAWRRRDPRPGGPLCLHERGLGAGHGSYAGWTTSARAPWIASPGGRPAPVGR